VKKSLLILSTFVISLAACEKINSDNYSDPILKIGDNLVYSYKDFELYDSSTHILYFKSGHSEIPETKQSSFAFYADSVKIYQGSFWPSYSSSLPTDPFISSSPFFYQDFLLRIGFMFFDQGKADPRNDDRLISAFKNHDLLHSGLSGEIKSIVKNGSKFTFLFVVINKDKSDLLIFDPDKMGSHLFHYFTNAPTFYNMTQKKVYSANTEFQAPSPWNSWNIDWLSKIRSGESIQFTFDYTIDSSLSPGEYVVSYQFPGLGNQVTKDQLYHDNIRIWLGDIQLTKRLTVQ
jgi:hypothetical protein